ncbi:MAG: SDR family oxidoreductase, partial [Cytophagales bacterium]|nr:SDR family oxidoreductase [Cytophagales bacterium]
MQTILVLGSKGFLGSHIQDYFSSAGWEVIGSDRMVLKEENYYPLDDSLSGLPEILENRKPDICINAAGSGLVSLSLENPNLDFSQNYLLVQRTLESIRQYRPSCHLVQISSAAVYGNPETSPIPESVKIRPISPYGWHKYQSELLCQEYY